MDAKPLFDQLGAVSPDALVSQVSTLTEHRGLSSLRNSEGTSLVLACTFAGRTDLVSALLERFPDVSLHDAAAAGDTQRAAVLTAAGTDALDLLSADGWTALHLAAHLGHSEIVALLLEARADPTLRNEAGKTPLDLAREGNHREVIARTFNAAAAVEPFVRLLSLPLQGPVLDLACGPGILSHALARAGAEVLGIDATAAMLERAREHCSEEESASFREASAYDLPFGDEHFAGAVTRLSIHHFAEPGRALTELRRVLHPGAALVLGDIVASSDPDEARLQNALETLRDPSHQRLLGAAELRHTLEAAGFGVEAVEPWANPKSFDEWAAVVEDARSVEPLRDVMESLRRAGATAGIDLRLEGNALSFTHHWCFIQARAT
jgi:ubiquinone/menaquinone biosynthesis C-methylase UbiE